MRRTYYSLNVSCTLTQQKPPVIFMNLTFHNFYEKKPFISKKYVEKLCLNICTNYHTKTIHEKPYQSNRNCLCYTIIGKTPIY